MKPKIFATIPLFSSLILFGQNNDPFPQLTKSRIDTSNAVNFHFDKKRKFDIFNDSIVEITQPYYYVGIEGKLKKAEEIFSSEKCNIIIA